MPPQSPLPQRNGLDAAWLRTENRRGSDPAPFALMRDWLHSRVGTHLDIDAALAEPRFVYQDGSPVAATDPYRPHTFVWFHRDLPDEVPVPGKIRVLFHDERIVVVDKPPFLSSIPRGKHIMQSVVVRMREQLELPELTPMHRLDRVTSGLLVLTTEKRWRGPYQSMFQYGTVEKQYRAVAPVRDDLELPVTVRNHLSKTHGVLHAEVLPDRPPNAESVIELVREMPLGAEVSRSSRHGVSSQRLAEYRLTPLTGKTHQLRIHMAGLGVPIVGDPLYPVRREVALDDFSEPLQLLASELRFVDPIDGFMRHFVSERDVPLRTETP